MPEFTVPDPIRNEEISTAQFEGERAVLWTSFTRTVRTGSVPPSFSGSVAGGQEAAAEAGYGDQVAFLPTTFDPERDTAETLREYAGQQGVDLDDGELALPPPGDLRAGPRDTRRALRSEDREDTGRRYREPGVPLPALRAHHSRQQAGSSSVRTHGDQRPTSNGSSTTSNESRPRESPWGLVGRTVFPSTHSDRRPTLYRLSESIHLC